MMYVEKIEELRNTITVDEQNANEAYFTVEKNLADCTCQFVGKPDVICSKYGDGKVTEIYGDTFDSIILTIDFAEVTKKFSLAHMIANNKFIKFVNDKLYEPLTVALNLHNELAEIHKEYEKVARQIRIEAEKKAEAEKRAEEKYLAQKETAVREFNKLVQQAKSSVSTVDEFYYALGWLTAHVGTVSASLPDYLLQSFEKYFGTETNPTIIDSKKRTTGGFAMKWAFSLKASLRGKDINTIPCILAKHLNSTGKSIVNTSFVWDLLDNYGFQFGKKQDVDKIKSTVPSQFINSFEAGLTA
jgi:ElaB/YqjD/DUF883 family membrane-anchored ribosome-binding protein